MKEIDLNLSKQFRARTRRREHFTAMKSLHVFNLPECWRKSSYDLFMGVTTPYEDEDVLVDDDVDSRIGEPWKVILYNDDIHTFEEVILQLIKALGCGQARAEKIAFEAHSRGKAIAYDGEFEECFRIMGILREIQLVVEIEG